MFDPSNTSNLSKEFLCGNLRHAMQEAASSTNKQVYQIDGKVRALTDQEARISGHAHLIGLNQLSAIFDKNLPNLEPIFRLDYEKVLKAYSQSVGIPLKVDEAQLRETAETKGFGYKKANLDQISLLCREDFGAYKLKVPSYVGVSSTAVQNCLNRFDLNLELKWKHILEKHFPTQESKDELFKSKKFPEAFLVDCAVLRMEISSTIKRMLLQQSEEKKHDQSLDIFFETAGLDDLLAKLKIHNERLMIRSTGKEDTKELANAGGNASVANVAPNAEDILKAFEETLISYFSEKSLKQRLGVKDVSLLEPIPFTPFIAQRMIGEQGPNALPKCGVMFTEDNQSKQEHSNENVVTSGITVIQSSYGHNEAVVTGSIPVDSFYVNDQGVVFPIIRVKTHRMIPSEKSGELQLVANDEKIAKTSSLSLEAVNTLKSFAKRLEQFYSGPMDVEFVVDEIEKTIYIVQARPLVERAFKEASFLPDLKAFDSCEILKGSAIGTAGGGLRLLNPSEIIMENNLSTALDKYQSSDTDSVDAIIVGMMAPSTSHWATVFHNEEKPVIYLNDLQTFQTWSQDPKTQILISPQQGVAINLGSEQQITLDDLVHNRKAAKGWYEYPAASEFSACSEFLPSEQLTDETIKTLCPLLQNDKKWENFKKNAHHFDFSMLIERIRHSQGDHLRLDLAVILYKFKSVLTNEAEGLQIDPARRSQIESLQSYALMLAKNIIDNGQCLQNDPTYCRKLLGIHFLHTLIFSQSSHEEMVDGNSLTSVALMDMAKEKEIVKELKKQGITLKSPYSLPLLRLAQLALRSETANQYRSLILSLDHGDRQEDLIQFSQMIFELDKLDMLSAWLNVAFTQNNNLNHHINAHHAQFSFTKKLVKKKKNLNALSISSFAQSKSFHTQWKLLNNQVLEYAKDDLFYEDFSKMDTLGKLSSLSFMNKLVDQFDLAIKSLERSSEFPLEKQLELFQGMLKGYGDLAFKWLNTFDFSTEDKKEIGYRLIEALKVIDKQDLKKSDLSFSEYFDVAAYGSRSGALLNRGRVHTMETLEDAFSVIHQELLNMLSSLNNQVIGTIIPLPPLLERAIDQLSLGKLNGIDLNSHGVSFHFTHALREHGVQYELKSLTGTNKLSLKVRFSAQNEGDRWDMIAHYMILLKTAGKFDINQFQFSSRGVEFTFHLDEDDNLESLKGVLKTIELASNEIAKLTVIGGGVPDLGIKAAKAIQNNKKQLKAFDDPIKVVQEFERNCGLESSIKNPFFQHVLSFLVDEEPAFVETELKKVWERTFSNHFFNTDLPIKLVKAGHCTETVIVKSMQEMNINEITNKSNGIKLMHAVALNSPKKLPEGISQAIFDILLHPKMRKDWFFEDISNQAFEILECLIKSKKDTELILQGTFTMLTSKNEPMQLIGEKLMKLLLEHQPKEADDLKTRLEIAQEKLNTDTPSSDSHSVNIHIKN